jgi:ABC-type uncharacterized transport system ATPase subunit
MDDESVTKPKHFLTFQTVASVQNSGEVVAQQSSTRMQPVLISSELDEILAVADRVLVLYRGRIVGECPAEPAQRERIGRLMAGHAA